MGCCSARRWLRVDHSPAAAVTCYGYPLCERKPGHYVSRITQNSQADSLAALLKVWRVSALLVGHGLAAVGCRGCGKPHPGCELPYPPGQQAIASLSRKCWSVGVSCMKPGPGVCCSG